MKWRLAAVFVFWQSETVIQKKQRQFNMFNGTKFESIEGQV